jgi:hypothetical protein
MKSIRRKKSEKCKSDSRKSGKGGRWNNLGTEMCARTRRYHLPKKTGGKGTFQDCRSVNAAFRGCADAVLLDSKVYASADVVSVITMQSRPSEEVECQNGSRL